MRSSFKGYYGSTPEKNIFFRALPEFSEKQPKNYVTPILVIYFADPHLGGNWEEK